MRQGYPIFDTLLLFSASPPAVVALLDTLPVLPTYLWVLFLPQHPAMTFV